MIFQFINGDMPSYVKYVFARVNNSTVPSLRNAEVNNIFRLLKFDREAEMIGVPRLQTLE